MKFNLSNPAEQKQAYERLAELALTNKLVEIKRIDPKRSLNQNSYLHLILGYFGTLTGFTLEEAKDLYKKLNHEIYKYEKKGRSFLRSSTDLDVSEMSKTIDKFREWSARHGYPLPDAENAEQLRAIGNQIERERHYL